MGECAEDDCPISGRDIVEEDVVPDSDLLQELSPAAPRESVLLGSGSCNCYLTGSVRACETIQEVISLGRGAILKFEGS